MRNPWIDLPETAPFVLACDKQGILDFNHTAKPEHTIHLELLPEPYTGNPEAKIILLNLNPGFYERNEKFLLGDEHFFKASRANLTHTRQDYPFYLLDPRNAASPVSLATALPRPSQHIPRKRGNAPGIFPRQIGRVSPSRWEIPSVTLEVGTANVCLLKVIHSESEELPCRFHRIQAA